MSDPEARSPLEPVLVAAVTPTVEVRPVLAAPPAPAPSPRPTPPNPFERRLSFDRGLPTLVESPPSAPPRASAGVSWRIVGATVALVIVVLAGALFVSRRSMETQVSEAVADATMTMATDDEAKAALADVVAAQAAHLKAHATYTSSPVALRAAAAKAPLRKGIAAEQAGAVYVDVPVMRAGDEPTFYLAARKLSGPGCFYVKGVPDGLNEATSAECTSGFAVDFGPSPQARRAEAMMLTAADLGRGWKATPPDGTRTAWSDVNLAHCLGVPAVEPPGMAKPAAFERGDSSVEANAAVWLTDDQARGTAALFDHPKIATCVADDFRDGFSSNVIPVDAKLTVADRGLLVPGRADVRRLRLRLDVGVTGTSIAVWGDLVSATRGRTEVVVLAVAVGAAPAPAETLRLVDAMLARGQ